jgi:pyrimidine deaminase RibD-like protein
VFVGIVDPDPRNNGKGLQLLRDAGIHVELGALEQEIREFLAPYLHGAPHGAG